MSYDVRFERCDAGALLAVRANADGRRRVADAMDCALPGARESLVDNTLNVMNVAADEWLIDLGHSRVQHWFSAIDGALNGTDGIVVDVSSAYARFELSGPDTLTVLSQAVPLDLHEDEFPAGAVTRCGFGRSAALLLRKDANAFRIYADVAVSRYVERFTLSVIG